MKVVHPLKPIYNADSKVLILGSFPSIKSRENNFYYGHPKNRFWKTLEKVFNEDTLETNKDKENFLLTHKIALFDVVFSCDIVSSSDSSIKNVIPNDIKKIVLNSNIKTIFTTGNKAYELYNKYLLKDVGIKAIKLPSPSPANCRKGIEEILNAKYKIIKEKIEEN